MELFEFGEAKSFFLASVGVVVAHWKRSSPGYLRFATISELLFGGDFANIYK